MLLCHTALMVPGAREGRPEVVAYQDDPVTGARCHVEREDYLTRCEPLFEALQASWTAQVDGWGWPPPLSDEGVGGTDGLDIYIHSEAAGGAYVNSNYIDADPDDGRMAGSSWMVLAPSIGVSGYPGYVAHEFNHVLQFATDMGEPTLPPWEGTAPLAEERTYPGQGSGPTTTPDYQATPWAGPLRDGYWLEDLGYWSYYEYGSVLLMQWLEDEQGLSMPEFWVAMSQPTWDNEPDFLDVLTQDLWREFTIWRAELTTPAVYVESELSVGDSAIATRVQPWGVVFVDLAEPGALSVEGGRTVEVLTVSETRLAVIDWGDEGFDADDPLKGVDLTLSLEALAQDTGSGPTDSGQDPTEPGCGCSSPPAGVLLLPLLPLLRRRSAKRPLRGSCRG